MSTAPVVANLGANTRDPDRDAFDVLEELAALAKPLGLVVDLAPATSSTRAELELRLGQATDRLRAGMGKERIEKAYDDGSARILEEARTEAALAIQRARRVEDERAADVAVLEEQRARLERQAVELAARQQRILALEAAIAEAEEGLVGARGSVERYAAEVARLERELKARPALEPDPDDEEADDRAVGPVGPVDLSDLPAWSSDRTVEAARNNDSIVLAVIARLGRSRRDRWVAVREAAAALGKDASRLAQPVGRLVAGGDLEHNGRLRTGSRYRSAPPIVDRREERAALDRPLVDVDAELEPGGLGDAEPATGVDWLPADDAVREDAAAAATVSRETPPPVDLTAQARAAAQARADKIEERANREQAVLPPAKTPGGTVLGRVLEALQYEPGTAEEVANRLRVPVADVARAIVDLEAENDLTRNGRRGGNIVYRGRP